LRNNLVFHKSLACFGILVLGVGSAGATTRPSQHKNSFKAKSAAVSSRKHGAHLEAVSAKSRKSKAKKVHGQQVIAGDRALQIQSALVRQGYLKGEPSGTWDQPTKDAMARYQADHGWQTKTLPDSRALIELGLGPSHQDAISAKAVPANVSAETPSAKSSALPEDRQ